MVGAGSLKGLETLLVERGGGDDDDDRSEEDTPEPFLFMDKRSIALHKGDSAYVGTNVLPGDNDNILEEEEDVKEFYLQNVKWPNELEGHIVSSLHMDTVHIIYTRLTNQQESLHNKLTQETKSAQVAIAPRPHQLSALTKIGHNRRTSLKSTIIVDPMSLGETLEAMVAEVNAIANAKRFSVTDIDRERHKTDYEGSEQ